MKLTIPKTELNEAIQHVSRAICSRTTIPILAESRWMRTQVESRYCKRYGHFDPKLYSDANGRARHHRIGTKQEALCLPAKFFVEMVRKLPAEQIELEVSANRFARRSVLERPRSNSYGLDPEEFPVLPVLDEDQNVYRCHATY